MGKETVVLNVFRFDPEVDERPRRQTYEVPVQPGMTVLDALLYVLDNLDGTLAFRYACRQAICGSCGMFINGLPRLACQTQISALKSKVITLDPLRPLPVIKDLVVDMEPFYEKVRQVMPYFQPREAKPGEREYLQSPKEFKKFEEHTNCIMCGCCYAACPMSWTDPEYLGPAALSKVYRFAADSRDAATLERLKLVDNEHGVWRCHKVMACAEVCPKGVNPTFAIARLQLSLVLARLLRKIR